MLRAIAVVAVLFTASLNLNAADAKKLEGTWNLSKSETPLPEGASAAIEFKKDGTFVMKLNIGGMKLELPGTWKIDGEKLTITQKDPAGKEKTETMTIEKLDDTDLITVDEKKKKDEFKKAK